MNDSDSQRATNARLRSVHTTTFPELLEHLGASLLVTTYQAGKLVVLRNDAGVLNTHFRTFNKPMGLAVSKGRLAIGCNVDIWEFHNVPAVCPKLDQRVVAGPTKTVVAGLTTEPPAATAGLHSPGGAGDA